MPSGRSGWNKKANEKDSDFRPFGPHIPGQFLRSWEGSINFYLKVDHKREFEYIVLSIIFLFPATKCRQTERDMQEFSAIVQTSSISKYLAPLGRQGIRGELNSLQYPMSFLLPN